MTSNATKTACPVYVLSHSMCSMYENYISLTPLTNSQILKLSIQVAYIHVLHAYLYMLFQT